MRTTMDLPEELVRRVVELSHQKTKTAAIITALEEYVRTRQLAGIKCYRGAVDVELDLDSLRDRGGQV